MPQDRLCKCHPVPGDTGTTLRVSSNAPPATCLSRCQPPWPFVHTRTHAHTRAHLPQAGSRSLPRAHGIQTSRGCPWPPAPSHTRKKGPSVCGGGRERGAAISAHVYLGPKKNPQRATLCSATPGLSHIPSLPEPTLGGPTTRLLHLPPHQRGDLGQALMGQSASTNEGAAPQAPGSRKPPRGPRGWASHPWPPLSYGGRRQYLLPNQHTPGLSSLREVPLHIPPVLSLLQAIPTHREEALPPSPGPRPGRAFPALRSGILGS